MEGLSWPSTTSASIHFCIVYLFIHTYMPEPPEQLHARASLRRFCAVLASRPLVSLVIYKTTGYRVKASAPKMDRNGYFFYVASTAKKKKISLMQPKPPKIAFVDDKRRAGVAERICIPKQPDTASVGRAVSESGRVDMSRGNLPYSRVYAQLESYQPKYHTIRENSEKFSECKKKRKETRVVGLPPVASPFIEECSRLYIITLRPIGAEHQ
ncbi:hypothetical protein K1T71_008552 [Dendrolimus kikuchii]|uniref:Uncharacterized protein n=1 Tax=Dendrolimus kikuchii TaxID=765133 RepID=A0ACC1CV25_9NEOP|nr:hypothetical protein K1T71_008552 [Dendrolimus kikuchii]